MFFMVLPTGGVFAYDTAMDAIAASVTYGMVPQDEMTARALAPFFN